MSKIDTLKSGGVKVKEKVSPHLKTLIPWILIVAILYYTHSYMMSTAYIPTVAWAKTVPVLGPFVTALEGYMGSWNWDKITIVFIAGFASLIIGYIWGRKSESVEVVEVNTSPQVAEVAESAKSVVSETKEIAETAGKTKAELQEEIEKLSKQIKELAE